MSLIRVLSFVVVSLTLLAVVVFSAAEQKQWPDVACHPIYKKDTWRAGRVNTNKNRWSDCERYEKDNGICPKVCFLQWGMLVTKSRQGDQATTVSVSGLVHWIAKTNGYLDGLGGKEAEELLKKVEKNIQGCSDQHPEIKPMHMNETCGPWEPFLSCLDQAYMCVKK